MSKNVYKKNKKSKFTRTTFKREFIRKWIPILIISVILSCIGTFYAYKAVVNQTEKKFEKRITEIKADMMKMCNDMQMMNDTNSGIDTEELEKRFALCLGVAKYRDYRFSGTYEGTSFTDFGARVYKHNMDESVKSGIDVYDLCCDGIERLYNIEVGPANDKVGDNPIRVVRSCEVSEAPEIVAKIREMEKRPLDYWGNCRYALQVMCSYIGETDWYPALVTWCDMKTIYRDGVIESEEKNVEYITYDRQLDNPDDYEYLDYHDENSYRKYSDKGRYFFSPWLIGCKKGGKADLLLDGFVARKMSSWSNTYAGIEKSGKIRVSYNAFFEVNIPIDAIDVDESYYYYLSDGEDTENKLSVVKESTNMDTGKVISYVVCAAAYLDVWGEYGKRAMICYISVFVLGILASLILAKKSYTKLSMAYQMMDYRKNLTATMAHDLKTPLMAAMGYAENLKENINLERREEYADKIVGNIMYMNRIVEDVLELSGIEEGKVSVQLNQISINELVSLTLKNYETAIEEKNLKLELDGELVLNADEKLMLRVLDNLIGNAIKYSVPDGIIGIKMLQIKKKKSFEISNYFIAGKDKISAEELLKPFVKGDVSRSNKQGVGLGLAIANELLSLQGFKLSVIIDDNKFIVTFS